MAMMNFVLVVKFIVYCITKGRNNQYNCQIGQFLE